jgi:hypothetical protein
MRATKLIDDRLAALLATDATTLAPVALANHVHLIMAPFVPGPGTDFTALTEAVFPGYAAKSAGVGAQQSFNDPATGNRIVQLLEPAGGWHFLCTGDPGVDVTIYGFVVTDNADLVTFGSEIFVPHLVITQAGDAVDIAQVRYSIPVDMIT